MAGPKDFTCSECGAQFDSRDKLDRHNQREHSISQADGADDERAQSQQGRGRDRDQPFDDDLPD
jgi:hypothetical protein